MLSFPAWDCLPYDRVSPKPDIESARLATLAALARARRTRARPSSSPPSTRCCSACRRATGSRRRASSRKAGAGRRSRRADRVPRRQRLCPRRARCASRAISRCAAASSICGRRAASSRCGSISSATTLEAIRRFDAETQLSSDTDRRDRASARQRSAAGPGRRSAASAPAMSRAFGPANDDDPLYEAVSAGRKQQGMEHWLPLFYAKLDTLFDFVPRALILLGHQSGGDEDRAPGTGRGLLRDPRAVPARRQARRQARRSRRRPTSR